MLKERDRNVAAGAGGFWTLMLPLRCRKPSQPCFSLPCPRLYRERESNQIRAPTPAQIMCLGARTNKSELQMPFCENLDSVRIFRPYCTAINSCPFNVPPTLQRKGADLHHIYWMSPTASFDETGCSLFPLDRFPLPCSWTPCKQCVSLQPGVLVGSTPRSRSHAGHFNCSV